MRLGDGDPSAEAIGRERALIAAARLQAGGSHRGREGLDWSSGDGAGEAEGVPARGAAGEAAVPLRGKLPGYDIEREIHRGGQGVVYLAVQRATRRRVAIKVMKEGPFAGPADRHRFEREARILGQINHPSIVAIHDSGTAAGCFYIVMNYIEGLPLDVYMRSGDRSLADTLRLFHQICDAVNAAHLRGVIHRDLKPSNILVDRLGRAHVLDFGLAKVEGGALGDQTILPTMTLTGQFVGSLPWSSPEQAGGDAGGGIDVRSDVYSLGVVLYQMLTGVFPYDVGGSMLDVARRIAHAEPIPPGEALAQRSRLGRLFGDRSIERIDDEVETIVLKCLSKDRDRRYQNAGELARDIGHYLAGEPIEAKRDSLAYVLGKQVKRHRLAVAFAATLAIVVLAGLVTSVAMWQRAEREAADARSKGDLAEQRAEEARQIAAFQQKMLSDIDPQRMGAHLREDVLAEARAAMGRSGADAELLSARLDQLGALLGEMNLTNVGVRSIDRDVLAPALVAIDRDFAGQPLTQAALLESIAAVYMQLGQYDQALPPAERALDIRRRLQGNVHPETLRSIHALALLHGYRGEPAAGEPLAREAMEHRRTVLGAAHPDTLASINTLGNLLIWQRKSDEAERYIREAAEKRRQALGEDHPDTLASLRAMESVLLAQGRYEEQEPWARHALEGRLRILGADHPDTLDSMNSMGVVLWKLGRLDEAEQYLLRSLEGKRRVQGDDNPDTLMAINNIGLLRQAQGRYAEAEAIHREALVGYRRVLGGDHPYTLQRMANLAGAVQAQGRLVEAEEIFSQAVSAARAASPAGWRLGEHLIRHGQSLVALARFERAQEQLLQAQEVFRAALGPSHLYTDHLNAAFADLHDAWHAAEPGAGHDVKAAAWRALAEPEGASEQQEAPVARELELGDPAARLWEGGTASGASEPRLIADAAMIESLLEQMNFTNIGVRSLDRNVIEPALAAIEREFAARPLSQATLRLSLSRVYRRLGDARTAAALATAALQLRKRHLGDDHMDTLEALSDVAAQHKALGAHAESELCAREVLEKLRLLLGEDDDRTLSATDHLASILQAGGKMAEAEELNRAAVERRRRLLGDDHLATLESTGRGIMLWYAGRFAEAEACFLEALEGRRRLLGDNDPMTLNSIGGLCLVLQSTDRLEELEHYRRLLVEGRRRNNGDDHPETLEAVKMLGILIRKLGRLEEAEQHLSAAVEGFVRSCGPDDLGAVNAMISLSLLRSDQGRLEEAEQIAAEVLRRVRASDAPPQAIRHYLVRHAQMLIGVGRIGEAEAALLEVEAMSGPSWPRTQDPLNETLEALAHHYDTLHAAESQAGHDARAAEWRALVAPQAARDLQAAPATPSLERGEPAMRPGGGAAPEAPRATDATMLESLLEQMNFTNIGVRSLDRNIIEPARAAIEREFGDQPLVQAALLQSVARLHHQFGFPDKASLLAHRAYEGQRSLLGASHVEALRSLDSIARLEYQHGSPWDAERYRREVLEPRRVILGEEHPDTLISMDELAKLLLIEGRAAEAETYTRRVTDKRRRLLGADHPDTLESITGMGVVLHALGRFGEAEVYSREAVEGRLRVLGRDHSKTHNSLAGHAMVLTSLGRIPEAESCLRAAAEGRRRVQGDEHPDTLASISNLGERLRLLGRFPEAEGRLQEAMEGASRVLGPDHKTTVLAMGRLALLRLDQGRLQEAEELSFEALRRSRTAGTDQAVGLALLRHAQALLALGRLQQAEQEITEAMAIAPAIELKMLARKTITALSDLYETRHTAEPGEGHDARAAAWRARLAADVASSPSAGL